MWVFLTDAFFSIVQDRNNPNQLMVRARLPGDLERHFPGAEVIEHAPFEADYRFRIFVDRDEVIGLLVHQVEELDYPDFKSQLDPSDCIRKRACSDVWGVMNRAQSDVREQAEGPRWPSGPISYPPFDQM